MITSIIFSKNRACQLDLLLRSIEENLPGFNDTYILYHFTNTEFARGYDLLQSRFPHYLWLPQTNFEDNTRSILNMIDPAFGRGKYICFFVDDNIIYRPCQLNDSLLDSLWQSIPELTCFTLRLGKNTVVQDQYNNQPVVFPEEFLVGNINGTNVLVWNWTTVKVFGDFGYPFSVDGHIYKVKDILPLLDYEFDTPNAFEGRFNKDSLTTRAMACFEQSALVNNPINIVGSSNNNAGHWYGHTLEELNEKFLDNYRISFDSICRNEIVAAHQEIEVGFEKF